MAILFSIEDILEMAIHIEEEGEKFYSLFAEKTQKENLKKLFSFLAIEERRHKETFKEIYENLEKKSFFLAYPDEEANKYLHSWTSSQVFVDWDKILKERTFFSEKEAIELAISLEKDSLLFYYGIYDLVALENKNILKEIINQEKKHWENLSSLKKSL